MFPKDLENYELRLKNFREESKDNYEIAEKYVEGKYKGILEEVFPRDVLGAKRMILWISILEYWEQLLQWSIGDIVEIFDAALKQSIQTLPLSEENKISLKKNISSYISFSQEREQILEKTSDISREPFFALVEDFALDGEISREEYMVLKNQYEKEWDFIKALETLPQNIRELFHAHISMSLEQNLGNKKELFQSEYHNELQALTKKWIDIDAVVFYVSRFYYKTPGRYRKYEHPKRRLRRTMKLALLKLLRMKLWNIEAEKILQRFEEGECFEDYFMILFRLLEVLDENPSKKEIHQVLENIDELDSQVHKAEETKNKILVGESLIMNIAWLLWLIDTKIHEKGIDVELLEKVLDTSTDIVWDEIHFNRESDEEMAWIYAETSESLEEDDEYKELNYASPEVSYEILSRKFHKTEEKKRRAFAEGRFDDIDLYNEELLVLETKLEKLLKIFEIET